MDLLFDNNTSYDINQDLMNEIEKCICGTLEYENFKTNVEVSLSIVDNEEIRELNGLHRGIDKATDVLSFPLLTLESSQFGIDNENTYNNSNIVQPLLLGDIIISIEKVLSQAEEYNHSIKREICFLVVHSMLHLLGYDHLVQEDEDIMFSKQEDILNNLGILR